MMKFNDTGQFNFKHHVLFSVKIVGYFNEKCYSKISIIGLKLLSESAIIGIYQFWNWNDVMCKSYI